MRKDLLEKRTKQGLTQAFTLADYPPFLQFVSRFTSFTWQNAVFLYMQKPSATCVAGMAAWSSAFKATVSDGEVPLMVVYPEYDPERKAFHVAARKMFDISQVVMGETGLASAQPFLPGCSPESALSAVSYILSSEKKMTVYPTNDKLSAAEVNGSMILVPSNAGSMDKFKMLLDCLLQIEKKANDTPLVSGAVASSAKCIVYAYLGLEDVNRIKFPYVALPIITDELRSEIFCRSFAIAKKVIERIVIEKADGGRCEDRGLDSTTPLSAMLDFNETAIINQTLEQEEKDEYVQKLLLIKDNSDCEGVATSIDSLVEKIALLNDDAFTRLKECREEKRILTFPPFLT